MVGTVGRKRGRSTPEPPTKVPIEAAANGAGAREGQGQENHSAATRSADGKADDAHKQPHVAKPSEPAHGQATAVRPPSAPGTSSSASMSDMFAVRTLLTLYGSGGANSQSSAAEEPEVGREWRLDFNGTLCKRQAAWRELWCQRSLKRPRVDLPQRLNILGRARGDQPHREWGAVVSCPTFPRTTDHRAENTGRWTVSEHNAFLQGLDKFGRKWARIAELVRTRTPDQVRSHAQKYFIKVGKGHVVPPDGANKVVGNDSD